MGEEDGCDEKEASEPDGCDEKEASESLPKEPVDIAMDIITLPKEIIKHCDGNAVFAELKEIEREFMAYFLCVQETMEQLKEDPAPIADAMFLQDLRSIRKRYLD